MIEHRIFRCGASDFYHNEILKANETHTDKQLKSIASAGFNGIWLRGRLRNMVPTELFEQYVDGAEQQLRSISKLCRRASRFGLGVWLYFTEPLGLPATHRFWTDYPELAGHRTTITPLGEVPRIALCPSTKQVRSYLHNGFATLLKKAPLAGVILITTSEQVNHCWGHILSSPSTHPSPEAFWDRKCTCPRCRPRGPIEVISDIIKLIHQGVKIGRAQAEVVAWDWSWNMHCKVPYRQIIDRLPKNVILMGDFERGGLIQRAGKKQVIEEYSLVYPGPSRRFCSEARLVAKKRPMFAKLQVNTTHELAAVPSLPLVVSLYRKFSALHRLGAKGVMATWNFACKPDTLNIYATNKLAQKCESENERQWLSKLAQEYFGKSVDSKNVVRAWYGFQQACSHYPMNGNRFVYWGPINYALTYPLKLSFTGSEMGPSWLEHEFGDHLEDSLGNLTLREMTELLAKLSTKWANAVDIYEKALLTAQHNHRVQQELATAVVAGCCFRSTYNIYRWYLVHRRNKTAVLSKIQRQIVADELENLKKALPLIRADSNFGFHEESKWQMFSYSSIRRKIRELSSLL